MWQHQDLKLSLFDSEGFAPNGGNVLSAPLSSVWFCVFKCSVSPLNSLRPGL